MTTRATVTPLSWTTSVDHGPIDEALARVLDDADGDVELVDGAALVGHLAARGYAWPSATAPGAPSALARALADARLPSGYIRPADFAASLDAQGRPLERMVRRS